MTTHTVKTNELSSRRFSVQKREDGFTVRVEDSWKGEWEQIHIASAMMRTDEFAAFCDMLQCSRDWAQLTGNPVVES